MVASSGEVTMVDDGVFYFAMVVERTGGISWIRRRRLTGGGTTIKRAKAA